MKNIDAVGGFDKELELELIDSGNPIQYIETAHIYDEKVSQSKVFSSQRTRWISSQYYYLRKYFWRAVGKLLSGKIDYALKAAQLLFPPRVLFPVILFIFFALACILYDYFFMVAWGIALILILFSYISAIPGKLWTKELYSAALSLPKAILLMLGAMLNLKGANDEFIHTKHSIKETPIKNNNTNLNH